jgi:signal transduction histidine kinase
VNGPRRSLLWRITVLHLFAVLVISVALPLAVRVVLSGTAADFQRDTLIRHEAEIARSMRQGPDGLRLDLSPDVRTLFAHGYAGFVFRVLSADGRVLFSSTPTGLELSLPDKEMKRTYREERRAHSSYYVGDFPERVGGKLYWVQVGQDLNNSDVVIDDIVAQFLGRVAWFIIPILAVLMLADFVIVRRALAPVIDASAMAGAIGPATLSIRLPTDRLPKEIIPLAEAMNQALDRLQQAFQTQQEFTADAAHELRTPLSIQRVRLEELTDGSLKHELLADTDRMTRIVNQLLQATELEQIALRRDDLADLHQVSSEVVEFLAPMVLRDGRQIALTGVEGPVWVHGDSHLLFRALRNLVENALAHTPRGETVEVEVLEDGLVRVMDRGPGVPEADRDLVFRRFWRRDRTKGGGAGLGLSIVARIVHVHGGKVWVEGREGGGAAFVIRLKRAESAAARRTGSRQPDEARV